tara:strand:+ start:212 stop:358 length:147 start_codon:yes stop_codon:yes gene_type:complete
MNLLNPENLLAQCYLLVLDYLYLLMHLVHLVVQNYLKILKLLEHLKIL